MSKTISFVMVGTNDLDKSSKFYDQVLANLGMKRVTVTERYIAYSHSSEDDGLKFYITKPQNKENATTGNGTMVALSAETKEAVDKFHKIALENGAVDEGKPGLRSDGNYYSYIRDLDGNKIASRFLVK
tara:strand:+ start:546 stop:932 length:387 start_codon:yes stop_codon:yes gene_type:complete